MSDFKTVFPKPHTFLPVVHVTGVEQATRNAQIAVEGGADGIFLINHQMPADDLGDCYKLVRIEFPDLWIGLNFLDLGMDAIDVIPTTANGLWIDNAGVTDSGVCPTLEAEEFLDRREEAHWQDGLYFGGVAFKHQEPVKDVERAACLAIPFVDVITTSGEYTGSPPDVEKIRLMRIGAGNHPLAIASGITPENVAAYRPYADCFIVSTGISYPGLDEFDPERVRAFANAL